MLRLLLGYVISDFRQHFRRPDADGNRNAGPLAHNAPDLPRMSGHIINAIESQKAFIDRVFFGSRRERGVLSWEVDRPDLLEHVCDCAFHPELHRLYRRAQRAVH